jgi:hypothetical protein
MEQTRVWFIEPKFMLSSTLKADLNFWFQNASLAKSEISTDIGSLIETPYRAEVALFYWTSRSDLSSTTKLDQNNISHFYKFGHT